MTQVNMCARTKRKLQISRKSWDPIHFIEPGELLIYVEAANKQNMKILECANHLSSFNH